MDRIIGQSSRSRTLIFHISLYTSVVKDGAPITERHKGALGELRSGRGNFSFTTFAQLNSERRRRLA